jgi:hypothetical protein
MIPGPWRRRRGITALAWGALKTRFRRTPESGWTDALAVVGVVLPVAMLVAYAGTGWSLPQEAPTGFAQPLAWAIGRAAAGPALLLALAGLRLRRTAALAGAALLIWDVAPVASSSLESWLVTGPTVDVAVFALALEAVALAIPPGPQRGRQLLSRTQIGITVTLAAAVGLPGVVIGSSAPRQVIMTVLIVVTMAGLVVISPLSRRVMVLLAVPAYFFAAGSVVPLAQIQTAGQTAAGWEGPVRVALIGLPLAVLAGVALAAALRAHLATAATVSQAAAAKY